MRIAAANLMQKRVMHTFRDRPVRISALRALFLALLISLMTLVLVTVPAPAAAAPGAGVSLAGAPLTRL